MGMFDSLYVECPECCTQVEFQSKSGECILARYTPDNIPLKILTDLDGQSRSCPKCGRGVFLHVAHGPRLEVE